MYVLNKFSGKIGSIHKMHIPVDVHVVMNDDNELLNYNNSREE